MTYLTELTELYYLQKDPSAIRAALEKKSAEDFANAVFVYGYESRDSSIDPSLVKQGIEIVKEIYESKQEAMDDKMFVRYCIGLAGLLLSNCQREDISKEVVQSTKLEEIIENLREVFRLLEVVEPRARGILAFQLQQTYLYAFDCLSYLKVENNNQPPDLDSCYVFLDSLNDDSIWQELARQLRELPTAQSARSRASSLGNKETS